ncbi:M67 family metallopeptidase [Terasakiella sp. SH-1]|uniref:Mov34/MPN/PAD-1 family protein n=1 Tax=Terasakiella sp. SH-1 TaxID=2560057 RepID=UPI001073FF34|nr:M67 family metallopeptidase [Terasakiella sp. SH-1]
MIIKQSDLDCLLELTRQAHPEECCGLIVGDGETVERLMPSANITTGDKTRSFELDPKVRFELIRESGERALMGFYHSHPNGSPFPSETDKSMVYEPELLWVITTLDKIKAFRFCEVNQDFEEIPIQVKL